jgi:hypothetical protein
MAPWSSDTGRRDGEEEWGSLCWAASGYRGKFGCADAAALLERPFVDSITLRKMERQNDSTTGQKCGRQERRRAKPATGKMPASRRSRSHDLERDTPLIAIAAARQVVEEAERWFGEALWADEAERLADRARTAYAHSASFRRGFTRRAAHDEDREVLYAFLRHWLAARLYEEAPALFARLPADYAWGGEVPAAPASARGNFN